MEIRKEGEGCATRAEDLLLCFKSPARRITTASTGDSLRGLAAPRPPMARNAGAVIPLFYSLQDELMHTYVALLRGINVGGNNMLPMKELRPILEEIGLKKVMTYLQSGNVVFQSESDQTRDIAAEIKSSIKVAKGFDPNILIVSIEELRKAIALNPFPEGEVEPKTLHVYFLDSVAAEPDLNNLEALKTETEQFSLVGRLFYLYAPAGIGRSKLAARVERGLGVIVTARNWRSVNKVLSMAEEIANA